LAEYIVIGLGRFGAALAAEVQALGNEVIGVDTDRQIVQEMAPLLRQAVQADATSEAALRELGVEHVDAAIVGMGDAEASIMITMILKKLGVPYVIAKAATELHGEILLRIGADRVVFPEQETAQRLAHGIAVPEVVDYLSINRDMGISKMAVPHRLVGKTHLDADLESKYDVRLVALVRSNLVLFGAQVGERFQTGDVLVLAGKDRDLRRLSQKSREAAEQ
jgi:trk system potassium uptake protein TrkA